MSIKFLLLSTLLHYCSLVIAPHTCQSQYLEKNIYCIGYNELLRFPSEIKTDNLNHLSRNNVYLLSLHLYHFALLFHNSCFMALRREQALSASAQCLKRSYQRC